MTRAKKVFLGVGALVAALIATVLVFAGLHKVAPVSWGLFGDVNTNAELALGGYDPVQYHTENTARPGKDALVYRYQGVTYRFTSEENRSAFMENASRYLPQVGGFCAFAVSQGFTADVDPEVFHVEEGRLYLFADTSVRDDWLAQRGEGVVETTDALWAQR